MKFSEAAGTVLFIMALVALHFLFVGTPSVWDTLHAMAMGACR